MELFIAIWLLCAVIGGFIATVKGRSAVEGVALGLLLGIIGLIVEMCLPEQPT